MKTNHLILISIFLIIVAFFVGQNIGFEQGSQYYQSYYKTVQEEEKAKEELLPKSSCGNNVCDKEETGASCSSDCPYFTFKGSSSGFSLENTKVTGNKCKTTWETIVRNEGKTGTDTIYIRGYDKFNWQYNKKKNIVFEKVVTIPETETDMERTLRFDVEVTCNPKSKQPEPDLLWALETKFSKTVDELSDWKEGPPQRKIVLGY